MSLIRVGLGGLVGLRFEELVDIDIVPSAPGVALGAESLKVHPKRARGASMNLNNIFQRVPRRDRTARGNQVHYFRVDKAVCGVKSDALEAAQYMKLLVHAFICSASS